MSKTPSLLGRLMWTFVSLSLVVLMLSGAIAWLEVRRETRASVMERLEAIAEIKAQEIRLWMHEEKSQATVFSTDTDVVNSAAILARNPEDAAARATLAKRLSGFVALEPDFAEIFVASADSRKVLASSTESRTGEDIGHAPFWEAADSSRFLATVYRDRENGGLAIAMGCPIIAQGSVAAILGIRVDLKSLGELIGTSTGLSDNGEVFFMDRQEFLSSAKGPAVSRREALSGRVITGSYYNYEGQPVLGAIKYLDSPGLVLFAEMGRFAAFATARRVAGTVVASGMILAAFMALGIYFASRRITRPILALTEAAEAVAHGDLSRTAPVMGRDQIGRLALTFNWMTEQLQALYADMREKVVQIQEARDAIAAKERHFRALIENASDLICVMNEKGRITYISPSVIRILGVTPKEVEGTPVFNWFQEEDAAKLRSLLPKMLAKKGILRMADYRVRHKNGGYRMLEMYGTNLLNDPEIGGFIINARDVTDRHKYLEELGRIEKLESIGVLAGGIAHDFNNMLTGILGNVSLARLNALKDTAVTARLKEAEKAILAARELTQQLLTFAGGGAPLTESASLDALLKEAVGFALSGGKVRCEYSIPGNLWPVEVDPGQIRQVVHNLVLNAVHAQEGVGVIRIGAENLEIEENTDTGLPLSPGRYVVLRIADEGHGISEKNLPRIFDPYFTTKKDGSGLGLAVTFQVIARHHGHIAVTSKPGEGAVFHIYLPASDDLPVVMKEVSTVPVSGRGERVLIMDDEEAVLDVTSAMLNYMGFDVEAARDGLEAVDLYRRAMERGEPFHAVIVDLNVAGGMGGKEAIGKILAIDPKVRGIVSSGYCQDPIMSEFSKHGFCGVIAKPYTPEKLYNVMEKVMKTART